MVFTCQAMPSLISYSSWRVIFLSWTNVSFVYHESTLWCHSWKFVTVGNEMSLILRKIGCENIKKYIYIYYIGTCVIGDMWNLSFDDFMKFWNTLSKCKNILFAGIWEDGITSFFTEPDSFPANSETLHLLRCYTCFQLMKQVNWKSHAVMSNDALLPWFGADIKYMSNIVLQLSNYCKIRRT